MSEYYSAREAAAVLKLRYHTFMYRAHKGWYKFEKVDRTMLFSREDINEKAGINASASKALGKTTG